MDDVLGTCLEQIWQLYDTDKSGYIDRFECTEMIQDILLEGNNLDQIDNDWDKGATQKEFEVYFNKIDSNGNGVISKTEMLWFLKDLTDL